MRAGVVWRCCPDEDPASASCLLLPSLKNGIVRLGFVPAVREHKGRWTEVEVGICRRPSPARVDKKKDRGRFLSLQSGAGCGCGWMRSDAATLHFLPLDANLTQNWAGRGTDVKTDVVPFPFTSVRWSLVLTHNGPIRSKYVGALELAFHPLILPCEKTPRTRFPLFPSLGSDVNRPTRYYLRPTVSFGPPAATPFPAQATPTTKKQIGRAHV